MPELGAASGEDRSAAAFHMRHEREARLQGTFSPDPYVKIRSGISAVQVKGGPGEHRYAIGPNAACIPFAQLEKGV